MARGYFLAECVGGPMDGHRTPIPWGTHEIRFPALRTFMTASEVPDANPLAFGEIVYTWRGEVDDAGIRIFR